MNMDFISISAFTCSSSFDSLIMPAPMNTRRTKATQWLYRVTLSAKNRPPKYPTRGINAWNPPNHAPAIHICFALILPRERPLQTDTANASIDRPIASIKSSKIFMCFLLLFLYKIIFQWHRTLPGRLFYVIWTAVMFLQHKKRDT